MFNVNQAIKYITLLILPLAFTACDNEEEGLNITSAGELAGAINDEVAGESAGEITGETAGETAGELAGQVAGEIAT